MSSRQYIKRVYRVPKDGGPAEYLAAVVVKSLVKHGWPARAVRDPNYLDGFQIVHHRHGINAPDDFWTAVSIAVRIAARTYRVDVSEHMGGVTFDRTYTVTSSGHFKAV